MPATKAPKATKATPYKKKSNKPSPKTQVQAPAPTPEPTPTPASTPEPEPTPVPVQETAPVVTVSSLEDIESQFASINARLAELRAIETSIVKEVRTLQKSAVRYLKEVQKKSKRKRQTQPNGVKRAPSGFAKPSLISNELCQFLGQPKGTEIARTEVTKFLTGYIKEHELQDPENRRRIKPDKKLQKLLNNAANDEVTYFNLQRYMKVHFPPSKASLAAAASSAVKV